jgi:hypothetical protein
MDPREYVTNPVYMGSLRFTASTFRSEGLIVGYEPLDKNPHHGEVWDRDRNKIRFSKALQKRLLRSAEWFVEIEGVTLPGDEWP